MGYYVVHQHYEIELPDTPYNLWIRGELWKHVNAGEGAKIEVMGGGIVIDGAPRRPDPVYSMDDEPDLDEAEA